MCKPHVTGELVCGGVYATLLQEAEPDYYGYRQQDAHYGDGYQEFGQREAALVFPKVLCPLSRAHICNVISARLPQSFRIWALAYERATVGGFVALAVGWLAAFYELYAVAVGVFYEEEAGAPAAHRVRLALEVHASCLLHLLGERVQVFDGEGYVAVAGA